MIESLETIRKTCKRRDNVFRGLIFIAGILLGEMLLSALGHTWESVITRIVVAIISGGLILAVSEIVIGIGFIEFFTKCKYSSEFDLHRLIHNFVEEHKEYSPAERARVALSIVLADKKMNDVEMQMPFPYYLKLLSAAAITTQNEWFATYRMPVDKWGEIKVHSMEYFQVLSKARMKKRRVIVRPATEIDSISYDSEIVEDTLSLGTGASLCCVKINDQLTGIEDYAIFDDELVITASPVATNNTSEILGLNEDPYYSATDLNCEYKVRLLRGADIIGQFLADKQRLSSIISRERTCCFTATGRNRHRREGRG